MTAYRDDAAALRHRLELATARAERAEEKLVRFESTRDRHWYGDVAMFLARALLVAVPVAFASFYLFFFSLVVVFDAFDDTRWLVALYALVTSPMFIAGPLAAWKTETPSRFGWGLALFTYLFMLAVMPPAALFGLVVLARGRTRDAVFGPLSQPVRVEPEPVEDVAPASPEEAALEEAAAVRTSRSARAAG